MKAHSDLVKHAIADGLNMVVDYDGEEYIRTRGYQQTMDAIEAVDEARLRLYRGGKYMCAALIILCNGVDEETVSDYTLGADDNREDDSNYIDRWFDDFFERYN